MKKLLFSCAAVFFTLSVSAQAEGWYGGVETGYIEQKYTPYYSYQGRLPSGRLVEEINDNPTSQSLILSLIYHF